MHELEKAMHAILNSTSSEGKSASDEAVALAKINKAAMLLKEAGFEGESKIVLSTLKSDGLKKQASAHEEDAFEVSMDIDPETIKL